MLPHHITSFRNQDNDCVTGIKRHLNHSHSGSLDYFISVLPLSASLSISLQLYQGALDIRQAVFGGNNLHLATAHEDLAYSSYVHEYSSGKFDSAK